MAKKVTSENCLSRESGLVVFFLMLFTTILLTTTAFTVDSARAYDEHRKLQIAADAAALASVNALGSDSSYSSLRSVVDSVAQANGISPTELQDVTTRCGTWNAQTFTLEANDTCDPSSTAVEVMLQRTLSFGLSNIVNKPSFNVTARSVGYLPPPQGSCIRPFGIEESLLLNENIQEGDTFSISVTNGGNWGKLDIGGNASSGQTYTELMTTNACDEAIEIGSFVSPGTGFAEVRQVFDAIAEDPNQPDAERNMIFAAISDMDNGNHDVEIRRFIKVDFISQEGNGSNWTALFRLVEWDAEPEPAIYPTRQLVQ